MNCRFVASDQPRVIVGRHASDCAGGECQSCLPCEELHCCVCQRAHARAACVTCLEAARSDLQAIGDLCLGLPAEAAQKGVQSEAMMLLGPVADPEAWSNRAVSAARGRLDRRDLDGNVVVVMSDYLEDCRDELHPTWVLGTWEQIWRDFLDHQTDAPFTHAGGIAYLDMQIGYMSEQVEPAFDEFARELRACRGHLEDVLREGLRDERGVPCSEDGCARTLVRRSTPARGCFHSRKAMLMAKVDDHAAPAAVAMLQRLLLAYPEIAEEHAACNQGGLVEHYECPGCHRVYTEAEYWLAVRNRIEEVS